MAGPLDLNPDFRDLLESLTRHGVEFLVVGAYALAFHGHPRYTEDLDVWIARNAENGRRLRAALSDFGLPISEDEAQTLVGDTDRFLTFGAAPAAVDLLNFLSGCDERTAFARAERTELGGIPVAVLSKEDYRLTKVASGRPKDLRDLAILDEG